MAVFEVALTLRTSSLKTNSTVADTFETPFIQEGLSLASTGLGDHINVLIASMTVSDSILVTEINRILESISMGIVVLTNGSTYHASIQEALDHSNLVAGIVTLVIQEGLTIDDVVDNYQLYRSIVEEVCAANDIVLTTGLFHAALSVAFTLADFISQLNEIISEQIIVNEDLLQVLFVFHTMLEDVNTSSLLSNTFHAFSIIDETITKSSVVSNTATMNSSVSESISFTIGLNIDGVSYEGWVLNPENFAVWNYNNFNFNSVTAFDEQYLMANSTGLYQLTGDVDDGEDIISKFKTSSLDFGTSSLKQVSDIILGLTNSGRVVLKVSVDGNQTSYYELKPGTKNLQNQRIKIGKGLYGRYWQFEVVTKDNSVFDLDTFEALPFLFKRKLR